MTNEEIAMLLAKIQVLDNRQVDEFTLAAWQEVLGDLDYTDANAAVVQHFRNSTAYITPAHVVDGAIAIRRERISYARYRFQLWARERYGDLGYGLPRPQDVIAFVKAIDNPAESEQQTAAYEEYATEIGYGDYIRRPLSA